MGSFHGQEEAEEGKGKEFEIHNGKMVRSLASEVSSYLEDLLAAYEIVGWPFHAKRSAWRNWDKTSTETITQVSELDQQRICTDFQLALKQNNIFHDKKEGFCICCRESANV